MASGQDIAFRSKLEVLLGERGRPDDHALRLRDLDTALARRVLENTVVKVVQGSVGGDVKQLQSDLTQFQTSTNATLSGISGALGRITASSLLRTTALSSGSAGALSRIGIMAEENTSSESQAPAIILEARPAAQNRAVLVAPFVHVATGGAAGDTMLPAFLLNGSDPVLNPDLVAAKSLHLIAGFSVSDTLVSSAQDAADPLTILSVSVSGYEDGAFTALFTATADNLHSADSFGTAILRIDGTEAGRIRFGVDVTGAASRFAIPISIPGSYSGTSSSVSVQLDAYSSSAADDAVASGPFYIRSGRLLVFGGVR